MADSAAPILWDVYEEHLEEAAFLWGAWENALVGASYTLRQVSKGPEERLRAHLDALVLGGARVTERLLLPSLADEDPGKVFAAAWSLLHAEDAEHFPAVAAALASASPPGRRGLARAFELEGRGDLADRLRPLWASSEAFARQVIVDTLSRRDPAWTREHLQEGLASREGSVLAAALRAVRRFPDRAFMQDVERAFTHPDSLVRSEAVATAYLLRMPQVWDVCLAEAESEGSVPWWAVGMLALPQSPQTARLFDTLLTRENTRRAAIWGLGFLGTLDAADYLVTSLNDEGVARLAGEALSAIMGVAIQGDFERAHPGQEAEGEEISPDDEPPQRMPEDALSLPNASTLAAWWKATRPKLGAGVSYVRGQPRSSGAFRLALAEGTMWRRNIIALELAGATPTPSVPVETRSWAKSQLIAY